MTTSQISTEQAAPAAVVKPWMPFSSPKEQLVIPPFDELTLFIYGVPKVGKTTFAAGKGAGNPHGNKRAMFLASEPGHNFLHNTVSKIYEEGLEEWNKNRPTDQCNGVWQLFQKNVLLLKAYKEAGKLPFRVVVLDVVDKLYDACLAHVCGLKRLAYPPENDFGKTWKEIANEWERWIKTLLSVTDVMFLTHATEEAGEIEVAPNIMQKVTKAIPTFRGKNKAQFIDGVVNAIGHVYVGKNGQRFITFKAAPENAAGDRTGVLEALGAMPNDFSVVAAAYEAKAKELGFAVKSKHG